MQPKKNPKADLNKNRNLYFVIGLSSVLAVTWGAVEYKSYDRQLNFDGVSMLEDDEEKMDRKNSFSSTNTNESSSIVTHINNNN